MFEVLGFMSAISGWLLLIYAGWRNQREAASSPLVETTNFGPRFGAIVEVTLHPDHAAKWHHPDGSLVFPNLGKDSSEIHGIREDDGKVS